MYVFRLFFFELCLNLIGWLNVYMLTSYVFSALFLLMHMVRLEVVVIIRALRLGHRIIMLVRFLCSRDWKVGELKYLLHILERTWTLIEYQNLLL